MEHRAKKLVIITEKIIVDGVTKIIEDCGATGYTITSASGKGSRGIRSSERDALSETYANVKIEIIACSTEQADEIAEKVAGKYFENYSGITYAQDVEILRPTKFKS